MRWWVRLAFALPALALLAGSPAARAARLVTGSDYPPFADSALPGGGMEVAIVRQVYALLGEPVEIAVEPWKRGYEASLHGRYQAAFPYVRTAARERQFLFSDPLFAIRQLVFLRKGLRRRYAGPSSLKGLILCQEVGGALPPEVQAMVDAGQMAAERAATLANCAKMTAAGHVDLFIINDYAGRAAIRAAHVPEGSVVAAPHAYAVVTHHLIVPRSDPQAAARIAAFNAGLARLKASGLWQRIVDRYQPP